MSSRPVRSEETPAPAARQPAPQRPEQLIETHKAWIAAAAGLESRHSRRRPRYFRPLAISTGILAAALLLASLTRGGDAPGRPADLAGELIPTLGADHPAKRPPSRQAARAFRGTDDGAAAKKRPARRSPERRQPDAARDDGAPAKSEAGSPAEPRVPEPSLALTTVPTTAPQVTDGRPAAEPDAAGARSADAQAPRTAAAVPAVQ